MRKKYLIILGGHDGSVVRNFLKNKDYEDFYVYVFEPYSIYKKNYNNIDNCELLLSAAWIYDGKIKFYVGNKKFQGHSLMKEKSNIDKKKYIEVPCIDFSKWVLDNLTKDDEIHIRMDIEGSEYEILKKMIQDKSINFINKIWVEFHHRKYPELDKKDLYSYILNKIPSNLLIEL